MSFILKVSIYFLLFISAVHCVPTSLTEQEDYLLVTKNQKVAILNDYSSLDQQGRYCGMIFIHNTHQSVTVEIPVDRIDRLREDYIKNHSLILPNWCQAIQNKGYMTPYYPFDRFIQPSPYRLKGYRYSKPQATTTKTDQDPLLQEITNFVQNLLAYENLTSLNLRMEDTFTLRVIANHLNDSKYPDPYYIPGSITNYGLYGIMIHYLFPTITKQQLHPRFLYRRPNSPHQPYLKVINHTEYAAQFKTCTLERRLYGRGLHQWVNHTIIFQDSVDVQLQEISDKCWYQFTDILPESTYVDSDERRQQITNYEIINVEKPAFTSKQYLYKYRVPLSEFKETGVRRYSYQQPIHFRYPAPSELNVTKIPLHSILAARISCIDPGKFYYRQFLFRIQENLLYERGSASIPNGDSSKGKIVSIVTLVVSLIAVLVIIKHLKKD